MSMPIVLLTIFVTKEIVLMHVASQLVEAMLDVKIKFTLPPVYVYQTTSEIPELHVTHVSQNPSLVKKCSSKNVVIDLKNESA